MNEPIVTLKDGKVVIELETRHAEILAMLLGTHSPCSVYHTINNYFSHYDETGHPPLCSKHVLPADDANWRTQDTMVTSFIHGGISAVLNWNEKYYGESPTSESED